MSPEKVWAALGRYDRELSQQGVVATQFTAAEYAAKGFRLTRLQILCHCRWMAKKCLTVFRPEFEAAMAAVPPPDRYGIVPAADVVAARATLEKAMRWLCYIQGACHVIGLYSCDELRDHSRGGEGAFKSAAEEHGPRADDPLTPPAGVIRYSADAADDEPGVIAGGPGDLPLAIRNMFPPKPAEARPEIDGGDVMDEVRRRPNL